MQHNTTTKETKTTKTDIYAQEKKELIKKAKNGTISSSENEVLNAHLNMAIIEMFGF